MAGGAEPGDGPDWLASASRVTPAASVWLSWPVAAVLVVACAGMGAGANYACDTPFDLTDTTAPLPGGTSLGSENGPVFHVHEVAAHVLDLAGCNPAAGGLQWIKAAAHTLRTDRGQIVTDGL